MFGYHEPSIKIDDQVVMKPTDKWDESDKKIFSINANAMNALYYSLTAQELNCVSLYIIA